MLSVTNRVSLGKGSQARVSLRVLCAVLWAAVSAGAVDWELGNQAHAVPILQLFVPGASYDGTERSWVVEVGPGRSLSLTLWVIADTPVERVRISAAYPAYLRDGGKDLVFTITPTTTGGLGGFLDPSIPEGPLGPVYGEPGTVPLICEPSPGQTFYLPRHGIFGEGAAWQEFVLGDFTLDDSPIADFDGVFPTPTDESGQINAYQVAVAYPEPIPVGAWIHFDAYGEILDSGGRRCGVFAPVSHDAELRVVPTPPMGTLLTALLGTTFGVKFLGRRLGLARRWENPGQRSNRPGS
jgi:hypothetical protein